MVPVVSDVVNIFVKIGAISSAHSLRIYVEILSGPFAFLGSRFFSNFCTPLTSNVSSLIRGAGGVRRHGILVGMVRVSKLLGLKYNRNLNHSRPYE